MLHFKGAQLKFLYRLWDALPSTCAVKTLWTSENISNLTFQISLDKIKECLSSLYTLRPLSGQIDVIALVTREFSGVPDNL